MGQPIRDLQIKLKKIYNKKDVDIPFDRLKDKYHLLPE
jgi:hypothetical protein